MRAMLILRSVVAVLALVVAAKALAAEPDTALKLEVFTAGSPSYSVTSTIVYGPSEAILVDAQFFEGEAATLAGKIAALGRNLTTVIVTHPDNDHLVGLALLHARFPQARIYMSRAGLEVYRQKIGETRAQFAKTTRAHEAPPAEPLAEPLPQTGFTVDGQAIEVIPDLQGDIAPAATNSVVWIPSLRALIAGDVAFDRVHLWLDESTAKTRAGWKGALTRLEAMGPLIVVAGHKSRVANPDEPSVLVRCRGYIDAFEQERAANPDAESFIAAMQKRFPEYAYPLFLQIAAKHAYQGQPAH